MLEEVRDLREEGTELRALLERLTPEDWKKPTPFKRWTPEDVVAHLHFSDRCAVASLRSAEEFRRMQAAVAEAARAGKSLSQHTAEVLGPLEGPALLKAWNDYFGEMCDRLAAADPKARLAWFGPDMGVRMFTTARLMETWAHGQDIYDLLGVTRRYTDRIRHVAVLGVKTFGWTFTNRGLEVPPDVPYVKLIAPSGAIWEWNPPDDHNYVKGLASDFCHVVTQGRNVADTNLEVVGETARRWMAIAQCFAGGPEDPPRPGERTGRKG